MLFRQIFFGPGEFLWRFELLCGVLLVVSGILIAAFPEILVALISTLIILAGLTLIGSAWRIRRSFRVRRPGEYDILDPM